MNRIMIGLVRLYQKFVSPLLGSSKCRFLPTCSQYAVEAYQKYGFFKATKKTIWRILRCNPFCKGGYDPLD
ncbi:MAG: membrane protein insertion efficiency factor YidD [Tissierellia bacterium]|nr:membrane protein insertion efficiency factor YidD [Tissierellia bacterium]